MHACEQREAYHTYLYTTCKYLCVVVMTHNDASVTGFHQDSEPLVIKIHVEKEKGEAEEERKRMGVREKEKSQQRIPRGEAMSTY